MPVRLVAIEVGDEIGKGAGGLVHRCADAGKIPARGQGDEVGEGPTVERFNEIRRREAMKIGKKVRRGAVERVLLGRVAGGEVREQIVTKILQNEKSAQIVPC